MVNVVFSAWDVQACVLLRSPDKTNAKAMKRITPHPAVPDHASAWRNAQTRFQITNVTVTRERAGA